MRGQYDYTFSVVADPTLAHTFMPVLVSTSMLTTHVRLKALSLSCGHERYSAGSGSNLPFITWLQSLPSGPLRSYACVITCASYHFHTHLCLPFSRQTSGAAFADAPADRVGTHQVVDVGHDLLVVPLPLAIFLGLCLTREAGRRAPAFTFAAC